MYAYYLQLIFDCLSYAIEYLRRAEVLGVESELLNNNLDPGSVVPEMPERSNGSEALLVVVGALLAGMIVAALTFCIISRRMDEQTCDSDCTRSGSGAIRFHLDNFMKRVSSLKVETKDEEKEEKEKDVLDSPPVPPYLSSPSSLDEDSSYSLQYSTPGLSIVDSCSRSSSRVSTRSSRSSSLSKEDKEAKESEDESQG